MPTEESIVSELITYASPARPASAPLISHTTLTIFLVGIPHVLASRGWSAIARSALPSRVPRSSSSSPANTAAATATRTSCVTVNVNQPQRSDAPCGKENR